MNTKQLWNALCLNPVTNQYFDGIYSADTLKEIREKPDLIICNTDPSNKPGEHWVLFFSSDNSVDFFDSLGRAGWPRHRENREFGYYFFQTGKTQGILL